MKVHRYSSRDKKEWDAFVERSKNGTFLLRRDYMEYHADRFRDHSLMIYDDSGGLLALMPANEAGQEVISHEGLTYGGLVTGGDMTTPTMLAVIDLVIDYLSAAGFRLWHYKTIPHIYHIHPAEEDLYCLFRLGARLWRRDILSVVCADGRLPLQQRRRRKVQQARNAGLMFEECSDFANYWALLEEMLMQRHGVKPTHSLPEITLLHARFPNEIRLHVARDMNEMLAGVVIYNTARVAHVQYIAASERGRRIGALDGLIADLMEDTYARSAYLDFGISTESAGKILNVGLVQQKEGFGARAIVHDQYKIEIPTGTTSQGKPC